MIILSGQYFEIWDKVSIDTLLVMIILSGQYFEIWDKVSIEKLQNEHHAVKSP